MSERHSRIMHEFLHTTQGEIKFDNSVGKEVIIENNQGKKLLGVLVEKSIAIPLSTTAETDNALKTMVQTNLLELDLGIMEKPAEKTCQMLGLPYCGNSDGLYSDPQAFGQIRAIHLHPKDHTPTQEDFVELVDKVFETKDLTLTIVESL